MASSSDNRLQLIIEAVNRTEAQFAKVKRDLVELQNVGSTAGAGGTASMQSMGQAVASARDHISAARKDLPDLAQKVAALGSTGATAGAAMETGTKKATEGMKHFHDQTQHSHSMLGSMVQMALLFGSMSLAGKLAESGIEYNKALEISKLGISAIMTSMGIITDQQGQVLQGQEKWNAAQQLSVEAQRELQKIAMLTPATYEELVQSYQGLLAPALGAKMTFQETLELTGLLTNSVKSMGLPMQQVVQEGRDLVSATIDQNSQLAKSLQITNEDVKLWRQKGTLFTEISKRLEGFKFASREFENTWEGAWSNFKDIAQHALGEGSKPLFDYIKQEMLKISYDMVNITRDSKGKIIDIQVKPEVIERIRQIAEELKKVVKAIEMFISLGGKLSSPVIWVAITVGIYKVVDALKAIVLEVTMATGGVNLLAAALTALGWWGVKQRTDYKALKEDAEDIRARVRAETDHETARLKASGVKTNQIQNLEEFGPGQVEQVRGKLPSASNSQIAAMLRRGIITTYHDTTPWQGMPQNIVAVKIDEAAAKQFLEGPKSLNQISGSGRKTPDEIKKENAEARSAIERRYQEEIDTIKQGEAKEIEAIKTGLKQKEELYQSGAITEAAFLQAKNEAEQNILIAGINAAIAEQNKLIDEWAEKKKRFRPEDKKELEEGQKEFEKKWSGLEVEIQKKEGELARAGIDERIEGIKKLRELDAARREGALKLLQEELAGEKELTRVLLEREKITPLEAEKRNIGIEQRGLEADYWNTFRKSMESGLTEAQIAELDAQLATIRQRMDELDLVAPDRLYKAGKETDTLVAKREEARISHALSDLEGKDKKGEIEKAEALRDRKSLLIQLLDSQEKVQKGIDPTDTTAWNAQQSAIDGTRQKLTDLDLEIRDYTNNLAGGFAEGIRQYLISVGGSFKQMENLAAETAQAMQQSFSDFFFDAMQGKLKSFKSYFNSFLTSLERSISTVMAQRATAGIFTALGFRAEGGSVTAGKPYVVGEKGMELFIPQVSGSIVPNHSLAKANPAALGGSSSVSVSLGGITVEQAGNSGELDVARAAALGKLLHSVVKETIVKEKRPGGLLY